MKIGIIGNGFVGKTVDEGFSLQSTNYVIDPKLNNDIASLEGINLDIIFICVPTPMSDDGSIDTKIIFEVFSEIKKYCNNCLVVIKSTVTPEAIKGILDIYPKTIYNPEFLREKHALEDFIDSPALIFGGEKKYSEKAASIYNEHAICKTKNYIYTDIFSASLVKYTINSFLALKVTFFNQIFHIFSKADTSISWQEFTNTISSDIRVGSSHMDVPGHDGKMGFGGACFPKDTAALLRYAQSVGSKFTLLEEAIEVNNKIRSSYSSLDAREKEQGIFFNKKL